MTARGAAAVQFAVLAPALLLLVVGSFEVAILLFVSGTMESAVLAASRVRDHRLYRGRA